VKFDENGALLFVDGKTGQRTIRIIASAPYLSEWLNIHPKRSDMHAPLWILIGVHINHIRGLEYAGASKLLRVLGKAAHIEKRMNPHNFRHSRATYLANRLTDAQLKQYFGWTQGSDMAATYIHMSGRDIDNAILTVYGILPKEKSLPKNMPVRCVRCREMNGATDIFCAKCGMPLTQESAQQLEEARHTSQDLLLARIKRLERVVGTKR